MGKKHAEKKAKTVGKEIRFPERRNSQKVEKLAKEG